MLDESALATLASSQHGIFTRAQASLAGLDRKAVGRRVRAGRFEPVNRRVLRVAGTEPTWEQSLWAAVLATPGGVVSHRSAAQVHGFSDVERDLVELSVDHDGTDESPLAIVHRHVRFDWLEFDALGGLPVTTPIQTLLDLPRVCGDIRYRRVLEGQLLRGGVDFDELVAAFESVARRGRPRTQFLRSVLLDVGPGTAMAESELERRFVGLLERAGIPLPELQVSLPWADPGEGRLDALYREERVVVELDGRRWHLLTQQHDRDLARNTEAQLAGYRILRFTWRQVVHRPWEVEATIRRVLTLPHHA